MATPEEQYGQILALLSENKKDMAGVRSEMAEYRSEMKMIKTDLLTWKPDVTNRVDELEHAVLDLGDRVNQVLKVFPPLDDLAQSSEVAPVHLSMADQTVLTTATSSLTAKIKENHFTPEGVKVPSSAHLELHPQWAASGSLDHGVEGPGAVYTVAPG